LTHNLAEREAAWRVRQAHFPLEITFARPRKTAAFSLTGDRCALNCAHCGGRYLRGMSPIEQADPRGATSCLISGGCDANGRVPVAGHLEQVRALRVGRRLNWHVGLIGEEEIRQIAPDVDVVSFDLVGDDQTIREVYDLDCSAEGYFGTYQLLRRYVRVVPHITIGLRGGRISGEYAALERLQSLGAEALVFLVLIPTGGTAYEHCAPPSVVEVGDLLAMARQKLPDVPIYLGCMRPAGHYRNELDPVAIQAGVNKIVNPSPAAVALATEKGLRVIWQEECCVF
jgi:uncharacterized radical SAM superfamily protein